MSKAKWKKLLPCNVCYFIVKNKHRLKLDDQVKIDIFTETNNFSNWNETIPYHTFFLKVDCIKRPNGQRNREIHSLIDDTSLKKCNEKLEKNCLEYHKGLWLLSHGKKLLNDNFVPSDYENNKEQTKKWVQKKKREFKLFYNNLSNKPVCYGKDCRVDFYLSPDDKIGLINKIKHREKLLFLIDSEGNKKICTDRQGIDRTNSVKSENIFIKDFIVSIYSKDKLVLKFTGNVFVTEKNSHVSLEELMDKGINFSSSSVWRGHV
ncbi:MAG: hypothetical protein OEV44_03805 [Spirochaetota bacterium]|nr:hypothetical protein [Spirochaetota bacterium]